MSSLVRFAAPEWFLLVPVLLFAAWRWRATLFSPSRGPLRLAILFLVVLLLAQPELRQREKGSDLWVMVDRSASASESVAPHLGEWEKILEHSKGPDDRLFFIDYATDAVLRDPTAGFSLDGDRNATNTALAIRYALSIADSNRASRLLLLTDGYSTESVAAVEERLLKQKVALDVRLSTEKSVTDFRVDALSLPSRVAPGEPFLIEFRVSGAAASTIPYEVERDGKSVAKGSVTIPAEGNQRVGVVRLTDQIATGGAYRYTARILPDPTVDAHSGNNQREQWLEIAGGPRVLLVTSYTEGSGDPLLPILQGHGFEVEVISDLSTLSAGRLQGARAVILNNVPAFKLPSAFLHALDFFVREQGGGLLMGGGKASFASGGYFGTPIGELLPVSMEKKQEQKKGVVAMAIILDRSGSMAASIDGATKMELADAGAARAIELLGPKDQVAVYAVDTEPHEVVPLSRVGSDGGKLATVVRRITSAGGGIYVYTGLKAAYAALKVSPIGLRHVILFADAGDAEEPGEYKALIAKMVGEGITISVIGLGSEADSDAAFLKDVAERGNGRLFFTNNARELPGLFEQETFMVARAAFIEDETPLATMAGWSEVAAKAISWPATIDGYNLSYLRPEATAVAVTGDEEQSALVAFWHRGAGRVAAVSFPLAGEFSGRVRAWPDYGDFLQTLTRWLHGNPVPGGLAIRTSVNGTELSADLLFDATWEAAFAQNAPRLVIEGQEKGTTESIVWERMEPGRYHASTTLAGGRLIRGAVQVGKTVLPFGPYQAGSGAEWEMNPAKRSELLALARASGGAERIDLASIWSASKRSEFYEIRLWLIPLLLVLFLTEAMLSRLGIPLATLLTAWKSWKFQANQTANTAPPKKKQESARPPAVTVATPAPAPPPQEEGLPAIQPVEASAIDRRNRFRRAKRGN